MLGVQQLEDINNKFLIAVYEGDQSEVCRILQSGQLNKLNFFDEDGVTPLGIACKNQHTSIVLLLLEALIERGEKINYPNERGITPLYRSIYFGHLDIAVVLLQALIGKNEQINITVDDDATPLHFICREGPLSLLPSFFQALIDKGEDIHCVDQEGLTPIFLAFEKEETETLQILLNGLVDNGMDINSVVDENGSTLLYGASAEGHVDIVKLLLKMLRVKNEEINLPHRKGGTALHVATQQNHNEVVELLLRELIERNEKINVQHVNGMTPFYIAALNGNFHLTEILFQALIDQKEEEINLAEATGATPLHMLCKSGHVKIFFLLLQYLMDGGKEVNPVDKNGVMPIFWAVREGHFEIVNKIVSLLLEKGEDISSLRYENRTLLYMASSEGHVAIVKLLLSVLAHTNEVINAKSIKGMTPLKIANNKGHIDVVQMLLSAVPKKKPKKNPERKLEKKQEIKFDARLQHQLSEMKILQDRSIILAKEKQRLKKLIANAKRNMSVAINNPLLFNTLSEDKTLLKELEASYGTLTAKVKEGIDGLNDIVNETDLKEYIENFQESISPLIKAHETVKNNFIATEDSLKKLLREQMHVALSAYDEQLLWVENTLIQEADSYPNKQTVTDLRHSVKKAVNSCRKILEKRSEYQLAPQTKEGFYALNKHVRQLQSELLIVQVQTEWEAKENKQQQKIALESRKLKKQIKNLQLSVNQVNGVIKNIVALKERNFEAYYGGIEKLEAEIETISIALKPQELSDVSCKVLQKTFDEFIIKIENERLLLLEQLFVRRQASEQVLLDKAQAVKMVLDGVLKHPRYKVVMQNKADHFYPICLSYQRQANKLAQLEQSEVYDEDIEHQQKRIKSVEKWILKLTAWMQLKSAEVTQITHKLDMDIVVKPILLSAPLVSKGVKCHSQKAKKGRPAAAPPLALTEACAQEISHLTAILERLPSLSEANQKMNAMVKINTLLLSIAILFEGMNKYAKEHKEHGGIFFPVAIRNIRDDIFHGRFQQDNTEENYQKLYLFAKSLNQVVCTNSDLSAQINGFFDVFSEIEPDYNFFIQIIKEHVFDLSYYLDAITIGELQLNQEIVAQFDMAFKLGQAGALLSDLKEKSKRPEEDKLRYTLSELENEIEKKFNMNMYAFRDYGTAVRHGRPEAIIQIVNQFCLASVKPALRRIEYAEGKENTLENEFLMIQLVELQVDSLQAIDMNVGRGLRF